MKYTPLVLQRPLTFGADRFQGQGQKSPKLVLSLQTLQNAVVAGFENLLSPREMAKRLVFDVCKELGKKEEQQKAQTNTQ